MGGRLIGWQDEGFPSGLLSLPQPPIALTVIGRWPTPEATLAIVGSRAASPYGRSAAKRLAICTVRERVAVVSGLARGVDRFALEAALYERGWPIAVLGCGADISYPPENQKLQQQIACEGTIVSEFPLGLQPTRHTFPRRNRIIAALSRLVLVVEAGVNSGALITAKHAYELGKDVLAVPGPIDSPTSFGTNRLIFDGASPVLDEDHLIWAIAAAAPQYPREGASNAHLSRPLLAALLARPMSPDDLALAAGVEIQAARSQLIGLELEGLVCRVSGGLYALKQQSAAWRNAASCTR
ncbi:MAG: DNA-processing protein DprA [Planctomycetota bacterium]